MEPAREAKLARRAGAGFKSVRYEAYGPGNAVLLMDCLTDDRDRTAAQVRLALHRFGGHLGARGSVSYLFNEVGLMIFSPPKNGKKLVQAAFHAGAEDVVPGEDGSVEVLADPIEFEALREALRAAGFIPSFAEVTQRASSSVVLAGKAAESMIGLLDALEALNDVQNVYTNAEIPNELLAHI
jgi:transcriptional/translational regulatory protein YebC/TACO1